MRDQWIAALRSGRYRKAKSRMRETTWRGDRFSPLGVAFDLAGRWPESETGRFDEAEAIGIDLETAARAEELWQKGYSFDDTAADLAGMVRLPVF